MPALKIPRINFAEEAYLAWGKRLRMPTPERNYRFHPTRKWEIDWAYIPQRCGVEINGGIWKKGGGAHSRPTNIIRDMEKHNALIDLGWRVWQFTPEEVIAGSANQKLMEVLKQSGEWHDRPRTAAHPA